MTWITFLQYSVLHKIGSQGLAHLGITANPDGRSDWTEMIIGFGREVQNGLFYFILGPKWHFLFTNDITRFVSCLTLQWNIVPLPGGTPAKCVNFIDTGKIGQQTLSSGMKDSLYFVLVKKKEKKKRKLTQIYDRYWNRFSVQCYKLNTIVCVPSVSVFKERWIGRGEHILHVL